MLFLNRVKPVPEGTPQALLLQLKNHSTHQLRPL